MVKHRKGFSASHSKTTSRRLRSATVGTHVPQSRPRASRRMNAQDVGFASPRKQKRAARGIVKNVRPDSAEARQVERVSQRQFAAELRRRARMRRIAVVAGCLAVALVAAAVVGAVTLVGSIAGELTLGDSNATSALRSAKEGEPFYTLVVADLTDVGRAGAEEQWAYALVRVDEQAKRVSVLSIPVNLRVTLSDGDPHPLRDAHLKGGDAGLVSAVASYMGVDVSHFVKTDAAGIERLVNELGDLDVNVAEEVDDPIAGSVFLMPGTHSLDATGVLTLLRATNFADAVDAQCRNQRAVLEALSLRLIDESDLGFLALLDRANNAFGTDVDVPGALRMMGALRGMGDSDVYGVTVPGYEVERDGVLMYATASEAWAETRELYEDGEDPVVDDEADDVPPNSFTLIVRNGAGIPGAAAQMSKTLEGMGFKVEDVGNTDASVYTETLVIYDNPAFEPAAQSVVNALGIGRVVQDITGFYRFDSDVLLVLGSDWKPTA